MKSQLLSLFSIIFSCATIFAQDFIGYVKKADSTASPIFQAKIEITEGDKPFKTFKTYFDGSFKFTPNKSQSYLLKISYSGYTDTAYTITTDKNAKADVQSITVKLKKDGMRLMGMVKSREEDFPIKGATIVVRNVMTRKELIDQYLAGNEIALERLILRHKDKIYTSIYLMVKDNYLAEDIFQETFIKAIDTLRAGKYNEEGKFAPWVARIAYNLCIDHFRKIKRTPGIVTSEGDDIFKYMKFEETPIEEHVHLEKFETKLKELVEQLPEEQKEVVILRHFFNFSFKEVSEYTKSPMNTCLGRMRYALINLRKLMEEHNVVLR